MSKPLPVTHGSLAAYLPPGKAQSIWRVDVPKKQPHALSGYSPWGLRPYRRLSSEDWIADRLRYAAQCLHETVEVNPRIRGGVPVIKGTRFTVAQMVAELADGASTQTLAEDFELDSHVLEDILHGIAIILDRPVEQ